VRLNDYSSGTTSWRCADVDVSSVCFDEDGCTARFMMDNKLAADDEMRVLEFYIGSENYSPSQNNSAGLTGWTRGSGDFDFKWFSGNGYHTVADAWGWGYLFTYRHSNCLGYTGSVMNQGSFYAMSHPHVFTRMLFWD
jgi:hypothetical protein